MPRVKMSRADRNPWLAKMALKVYIIIVHPRGVVFPRAKSLGGKQL